jgi:polysaccharide biosynthesis protein PslH
MSMRVLFLTPYVPFPPDEGGRIRVYELLRVLVHRHEVDVLTLSEGSRLERDAVQELRSQGLPTEEVVLRQSRPATLREALRTGRSLLWARFASPEFADAMVARGRAGSYDVIQCEFAYMGQYARLRDHLPAPRWVLDEHNIEFDVAKQLVRLADGVRGAPYRLYGRRETALRRREELEACRAVDHVLTVSERDRRVLADAAPDVDSSVVPNGVDVDRFHPVAPSPGAPGAVFVGKLDYRPNLDAVVWFCDEVLDRVRSEIPGFTFTIVGAASSAAARRLGNRAGVLLAGRVPEVGPHLERASVVVVPIRAGGGTRLKVLEAMASGCAIVSTSVGCEGLEVTAGHHLAVADSSAEFAREVVRLIHTPSAREKLGRSGRELVQERYAWSGIATRLEGLYSRLVDQPAGRREASAV